jgi:hypothetical protein
MLIVTLTILVTVADAYLVRQFAHRDLAPPSAADDRAELADAEHRETLRAA